jgi:cell division protein FtsN
VGRSRTRNHTIQYIAGAIIVIGIAFCTGYFVIGGSRQLPTAPENTVAQDTLPKPEPSSVTTAPPAVTPRAKNSDYVAPGAPHIKIIEEKAPSLLDMSKNQPKSNADKPNIADSESSQEATPPPAIVPTDGGTAPDDSTTAGSDANTPQVQTQTNAPDDSAPAAPNSPPPPPSDPDEEQVNGRADMQSGQTLSGGKAQFRVQTGSFDAAENAQALADALRRRGYSTSMRSERDGDKTVYKVQIGAYRSRAAADKAAQELQSSGYPAYVSSASP